MLKSKGLYVLSLLAVLSPLSGYAFPTFHKDADIEKLLFGLALDSAKNNNPILKLSDGKSYTLNLLSNPLGAGEGDEPDMYTFTPVISVLKDADTTQAEDFSNFQRFLKYTKKLVKHGNKDLGELSELGVLYQSAYITDKTPAELDTEISELVSELKNYKESVAQVGVNQLVDLFSKENEGDDEDIHFVKKVGESKNGIQQYALKIRNFTPVYFSLDRNTNVIIPAP